MPDLLSLKDFAPHVHTRFQIAHLDDYSLELTEAIDYSNAKLEQFSLRFTGVPSPWLPQALYQLEHPVMGVVELFLVPNGPDSSGMRYESSFSRFLPDKTNSAQ